MSAPNPDYEEFRKKQAERAESIRNELGTLINDLDAEYAFRHLISILFLQLNGFESEREENLSPAISELAAFHLYPFFGQSGSRDKRLLDELVRLLNLLNHLRGAARSAQEQTDDPELDSIVSHLQINSEYVRGSSFPEQTEQRIRAIQGRFEKWFQNKAGIGPIRALTILDHYQPLLNERVNDHRLRFSELKKEIEDLNAADASKSQVAEMQKRVDAFFDSFPMVLSVSYAELATKIKDLSVAEWNALKELVGMTHEKASSLKVPSDVSNRPIFFLSGDSIAIVDLSCVYDALFDAYDRLTRSDQSFRDKKYIRHLSDWMEKEATNILQRIFPANNVYRQLTYPDPDKEKGEAELDGGVQWGPFLLLIEVKGRQFRPQSRFGDIARLRDDLRKNIEDAHDQANRANRYIQGSDTAVFREKASGRELSISKSNLRRIYPISVTLHFFAGLTTQLSRLKSIGLFRNSDYPWSVSLADLDTITEFVESPDIFLHYIQRRIELQSSESKIYSDELDLFGVYLDTRLHPSLLWERKTDDGQPFDFMNIGGGSERFDEWYQYQRGFGEKPDIRLDLPDNVTELLDEFRRRAEDHARWIAFALLDLSPEAINAVSNALLKYRSEIGPPGKLLRWSWRFGDISLSLVFARGFHVDELRRHTFVRANLERYRHKADRGIAIGIEVEDKLRPFECCCMIEEKWEYDDKLESMLQDDSTKQLTQRKLPGRNEPCICGSGLKFKKCCEDRIRSSHRR